jgi:hypothetical protein
LYSHPFQKQGFDGLPIKIHGASAPELFISRQKFEISDQRLIRDITSIIRLEEVLFIKMGIFLMVHINTYIAFNAL